MDLADEHSERELERSLVKDIRRFLIEMGGESEKVLERIRAAAIQAG